MADNNDLQINIGASTGELQAELKNAERELKNITDILGQFQAEVAKTGAASSTMESALGKLGSEAGATAQRIRELKDSIASQGELDSASSSAERLGKDLSGVGTASHTAADGLRAQAVAAGEAAAAMQAASAAAVKHLSLSQALAASFGVGADREILSASASAGVLSKSLSAAAAADAYERDQRLAREAAEAEKAAAAAAVVAEAERVAALNKSVSAANEATTATTRLRNATANSFFVGQAPLKGTIDDVTGVGRAAAFTQAELDEMAKAWPRAAHGAAEVADGINAATNASVLFGREGRHVVALIDEMARGQRGAMFSSLGSMARDSGLLEKAFEALATPWGAVVAAIAAAGAGLGYLAYQSYEFAQATRQVGAGNLLSGQGGIQSAEEISAAITKLADTYGLSYREAEKVAVAFAEVTGISNKQREAIEGLAAAQAKLKGADAEKTAEQLAKVFEGSGKSIVDYGEKIQLITPQEKAMLDTLGDAEAKSQAIDLISQRFDRAAGSAAKAEAATDAFRKALASIPEMDASAATALGQAMGAESPIRGAPPGVRDSQQNRSQQAMQRFQDELGLSRAQAAGLVGVLHQETSGLDPSTVTEGHVGLAQMSKERASAAGITPSSSFDDNISAIVKELQGPESAALARIKGAMTPQAAAAAAVSYERPEGYGPNDPRKGMLAAYTGRAQTAAADLYGSPAPSVSDKDSAAAIEAGSKAKQQQLTIENQLNDAQRAYQQTLQGIDAAEAAGNKEEADKLRLAAASQAAAIKELELRQGGIHTGAETDRHNQIMRDLQTEGQQFGLTDQQITSIAQRQASEVLSYGRNTDAARAESRSILAAAEKKISDEDLRDQLHNTQLSLEADRGANAEKLRAAQDEYEAIVKVKSARDPAAQAKEVEIARLKNQISDEAVQRQITDLKTELAKVPPIERQLELKKQINALQAQLDAHQGGGLASAQGKQALADAEAQRTYQQQSFQDQMRFAEASERAGESSLTAEKARLDAMVAHRQITTQEAGAALATLTSRVATESEAQFRTIADGDNASVEEKERAYDKIVQIAARAAAQEEEINKRTAQQQTRTADTISKAFEHGFDAAGSAFENFAESAIMRTETFQQAITKLIGSLTQSLLREVGTATSQLAANALGGKEGQSLGGVFASKIGGLFNFGGGSNQAGDVAEKAAAEQVNVLGDASSKLTSLLGLQSAAHTLNTASTGANTLSTASNTIATNADTTAQATQATTEGAGGVASGIGGVFKALPLIGGLFEKGGIVPSAAGGFLVPGAAAGGGQLAILHPREMVLPAHISEGVQSMIANTRISNSSANMTYAPTINGGTPFMTRSSVESMLRSHGSSFEGYLRNMAANSVQR